MNILIVHSTQINNFPPVRNLIEVLLRNGHKVTVITKDKTGAYISSSDNLKYIIIPETKTIKGHTLLSSYINKRRFLRNHIKKEMVNNDLIWTTTDTTVRDIGKLLFKYKHVMQLMELIEDVPAFPGQSLVQLHIKKYARAAYKVVVPEYNRAHIQKVWWNLDEVPVVLPNKPAGEDISTIPEDIQKIEEEIKKETRKIVLYQGVFHEDRNLEAFAQAVEHLNNEYCLYIMGADNAYRKSLCERHPEIKYIPFIKPPYHLIITKHATIGLMPYVPKKVIHYSVLNALYCAPNKIYEYAKFGVPMIGTDVPGLSLPFKNYNIGLVCDSKAEDIESAIRTIAANYKDYSNNCKKFFVDTNLDEIVQRILE